MALKAAHSVDPGLRISYVGVCGTPTDNDKELGFDGNNRKEFKFLTNQDWLFFDDEPPGLSIVKLTEKNERYDINIDPGANNKLKQYIMKSETTSGQSFTEFLSSTHWIHLSSLADFDQFLFVVEKIREAKAKNPLIRVSVDPGQKYVKDNNFELSTVFSIADYVFLSEKELGLLVGDESISGEMLARNISSIVNKYNSSNSQVVVIKKADKNQVYSFQDGELHVATFWHRKLSLKRIHNDTGAGDIFAGGFIAALLSPRYIVHQPFPIKMGAVAATARLKSKYDPFNQIRSDTHRYIEAIQNEEKRNIKQKFRTIYRTIKEHIPAYIYGVISGLIVWGIQMLLPQNGHSARRLSCPFPHRYYFVCFLTALFLTGPHLSRVRKLTKVW